MVGTYNRLYHNNFAFCEVMLELTATAAEAILNALATSLLKTAGSTSTENHNGNHSNQE